MEVIIRESELYPLYVMEVADDEARKYYPIHEVTEEEMADLCRVTKEFKEKQEWLGKKYGEKEWRWNE